MAGLKTFLPKPPKTILPKTMPKTMPTAAIQNGVVGGRERPKRAAVTQTAWEILPFLAWGHGPFGQEGEEAGDGDERQHAPAEQIDRREARQESARRARASS
jgi:hypothetical protein